MLLDHAVQIEHQHVIALSATAQTEEYIVEIEYLVKCLQFKCLDSKIDGTIDDKIATKDSTLEQFMQNNANFAKMIFNTEQDFEC